MKREILILCLLVPLFLLIAPIQALDLEIEKEPVNDALIPGTNILAVFDVKIKNNGPADNFKVYNLIGFRMAPVGTFQIASGATKNIQVMVYPREDLDKGYYVLEYSIQGQNKSEIKDKLTLRIQFYRYLYKK